MDSNPEEFGDNGRWEGLIIKYRSYLPVQDRTAMEDKINSLRLDSFHKDVMNKLLAEPSETVVVTDNRYIYQGSSTIPVGGISPVGRATTIPLTTGVAYSNQCISPSTVNTANLNLSESSIKSIAAALGAYANVWRP
jgi:hypothetical protein